MASYSREVFLKQLDDGIDKALKSDPEAKFPYYRKAFKLEKYRREFIKIPSVFRGTSHFGDDLIDGSKMSNFILGKELKITSDIANCTIFTGGRIFHRGGFVDKGERWAIQIGFRQREHSWTGFKTRVKRGALAAIPTPVLDSYRKLKSIFLKRR
jgi:hypothetical protein